VALEDWCGDQDFDEAFTGLVCYAGDSMAGFRASHVDGDLTAWNAVDLGEYLLDFVPRKVGLDDDHLARFPQAVTEVLRFLGETGRLDPIIVESLAAAASSVSERFVDRATDPRSFGPAKAMARAMLADGVDLSDQRAIDGWIAAYNLLPEQERHRRVPALTPPAFPVVLLAAPSPTVPSRRKKQAKARKVQRQARRRNRRT
jgi:hypothetical protein